jgi:dephospho-CoA kinase
MVLRVAITGGIACGKSLFSHSLRKLGVEVLDADEVVHGLESPGGRAVREIAAAFGPGVVAPDGGVDRRALGEIVFGDEGARLRLNRIVHPLVRAAIDEWLSRPGQGIRAAVIPLLFEVGWLDGWDVIICLASGEGEQMRRLMERRGLTAEQALARVASQMPVAEKAARAHLVVNNSADEAALEREAQSVYRLLVEKMV